MTVWLPATMPSWTYALIGWIPPSEDAKKLETDGRTPMLGLRDAAGAQIWQDADHELWAGPEVGP